MVIPGLTRRKQKGEIKPMTDNAQNILFDEALVADPDEPHELADSPESLLTDDEIKGARCAVRIKAVEPSEGGFAVALAAVFDPPPNARFTYARVSVQLKTPEGMTFASIAPTEVRDSQPVKIVQSQNLSLTLKAWKVEAGAVGNDRETEYTWYECIARGSGAGSDRVRWTFEEHDDVHKGIGPNQMMSFTVNGDAPIGLSVQITCNVIRPGLAGLADRTRTLLFGEDRSSGRRRQAVIEPPEQKAKSWFFG